MAKIFIIDATFGVVGLGQVNPAERERWGRASRLREPGPTFAPFDHHHTRRTIKINLETGTDDLLRSIEAVEVEMRQRKASSIVLVDQSKGGRLHPGRNAKTARQSFHELSLAGTEFAGEADDPTRLGPSSPKFAESEGLVRTVGNERIHEG